jgi:hypothetical protein
LYDPVTHFMMRPLLLTSPCLLDVAAAIAGLAALILSIDISHIFSLFRYVTRGCNHHLATSLLASAGSWRSNTMRSTL